MDTCKDKNTQLATSEASKGDAKQSNDEVSCVRSIPLEMWHRIFLNCDIDTLRIGSEVCKFWRDNILYTTSTINYWKERCYREISPTDLKTYLSHERKDEKTFKRIYLKSRSWRNLKSIEFSYSIARVKDEESTTYYQLTAGDYLTNIIYKPNDYIYVKNEIVEFSFGRVVQFTVYGDFIYFITALKVWKSNLTRRDSQPEVIRHIWDSPQRPLTKHIYYVSLAVVDDEVHTLTVACHRDKNPIILTSFDESTVLKQCEFTTNTNTLPFNGDKVWNILDKNVIGMLFTNVDHNEHFLKIYAVSGGIAHVYILDIYDKFKSYLRYVTTYGNLLMLGLQNGRVMLYNISSWTTFSLSNYHIIFKVYGKIESIRVEENAMIRTIVVRTSRLEYKINGSIGAGGQRIV